MNDAMPIRCSLNGIRVVDFSQIGAGPSCGMLLADLGASVVKVETPDGDPGRRLGPPWYGCESPVHIAFNRGKRNISIDLRTAGGRRVATDLAAKADVLLESFRPGILERFGLGYSQVHERNPQLIYCSVTGFGQTGPLSHRAGVDGILQAMSGLMSLIGNPGAEPCKVQTPVVDVLTGYIATLGVLARLFDRARTGQGAWVDVSLFTAALALQQVSLTAYIGDQQLPQKMGSAAPYSAPNEAFEASDGWVMVAAYLGERWQHFCKCLNAEFLLDDPRFRSSSDRVTNRREMRAALAPSFRGRTCKQWLETFEKYDILCAKVSDYQDVLANPQFEHCRMLINIDHPRQGNFRTIGFPIDSLPSNALPFDPAANQGEHSREILFELGYSSTDVDRLLEEGCVLAERRGTDPTVQDGLGRRREFDERRT
jgi:crotonobetainyl-CoA:carnitine CoA-transferase CaiB-like acyl-CoA transferase